VALIPKRRANHDYEGNVAAISLAGVRPLLQDTVVVTAGDDDSYTVDGVSGVTRRLVCFHNADLNDDIRVALNVAATADDMPITPGVYFVMEVETDDVVSFFNTSGADITVNVMEIG
jgi:hypothetical protein